MSSTPLIGILALQGDFAAHAAVLERLGCAHRLVRRAADLDGLDGIILPGGESTTMVKLLAEPGFFDRLRETVAKRPAFGTCAGAILLARRVRGFSRAAGDGAQASLGALDMTVDRNAYGRQIDSSIRTARVRPAYVSELGAAELEAVLIRAPRFREIGPGVEVVAEADGEPLLLRQGHVFAASFHPELSSAPDEPASESAHPGGDPVHRWFLHAVASGLQSP